MSFYRNVEIIRYEDGEARRTTDVVVEEYPLTLFVGGKELVTLLCSPEGLEYLVVGFLLSEGFIEGSEDIKRLRIDKEKGIADIELSGDKAPAKGIGGSRTITSVSGKVPTFHNMKGTIDTRILENNGFITGYEDVLELMEQFGEKSEVFKKTGGVHSCALGLRGRLEAYHEDIGRHNAMDKAIGHGMEKGIDFGSCIVLTSGRIPSEMLIKAAKRGIPIIASRSAPTALAVELASKLNITLAGFIRGRRFNVYSGFHRIK
jgi:FdhD protein